MITGSRVLAVAGAKGGVGKTTSTINLGASIASEGYSVVAVELDLAMANFVDFLDFDIRETTTLFDVLGDDTSVEDAIVETPNGIDIVPSGVRLQRYADIDLERLPEVIKTLRWHYDIVLLDTPAGLSEETILPLRHSDEVLLVSTPRVASVRNTRATMKVAERVDTSIRGFILTRSGTGRSPGADQIADFLDLDLLGHVPEDEAVPHSQDQGQPVVQEAPQSSAAIAYRMIARMLVDDDIGSTDSLDEPMTAAAVEALAAPSDFEANLMSEKEDGVSEPVFRMNEREPTSEDDVKPSGETIDRDSEDSANIGESTSSPASGIAEKRDHLSSDADDHTGDGAVNEAQDGRILQETEVGHPVEQFSPKSRSANGGDGQPRGTGTSGHTMVAGTERNDHQTMGAENDGRNETTSPPEKKRSVFGKLRYLLRW